MHKAVKTTLQIAFLIAMIYVLAAVLGMVQGFSLRGKDLRLAVGRNAERRRRPQHPGAVLSGAYKYANTGMRSTLIASAGTDVPRVGIQSRQP